MVQKYLLTFAKTGDTQVNCLVVDPDELSQLASFNSKGIDLGNISVLPYVDDFKEIMSYLIQYNKPVGMEMGHEEVIGTAEDRERRTREIPSNDEHED